MAPYLVIAALAIALAPACLGWWRDRRLAALIDDPAFPERQLATARYGAFEVALCVATLMVAFPRHAAWAIPLLVMARCAAGHPLRKIVFGETWSLGAYLWFVTRVVLGVYGFWILLTVAPFIVRGADARAWATAGTIAAILFAWQAKYTEVMRWVLRARPVDDPALLERFASLVAASDVKNPRLDYVPIEGGVIANALALPAIKRPGVLLSDTLLARFDRDEVAAICGHELAHLEYYNPRHLRRLGFVTYALILVGAFVAPALQFVAPRLDILTSLFPIAVFWTLVARGRHRQKHETASDLRAVQLAGDPEALVRALVRLNTIARLPRRWDTNLEQRASHPSLARRIQAIRAASGRTPENLSEAATFASADGRLHVTFKPEHMQWQEGEIAQHSVAYTHLSELRVAAPRSGAPTLLAVDRTGRRWEIALAASDVIRVQALLDVVDVRLAAPAAADTTHAFARAMAAITAGLVLSTDHRAAMIAALIAVLQPSSPFLSAAGIGTLATALLVWRDGGPFAGDAAQVVIPLVLVLASALLLAFAWTRRHVPAQLSTEKLLGVLAVCGAIAWCLVLMSGTDPVRVNAGMREWPAAAVLPVALAAALAWSREVRVRYAAAPAAIVGLAAAFLGSTAFLDAFSDDAFLAPAPLVTVKTIAGAPRATFPLSFPATDLRVSPGAASIAVASEDDDERVTFHVGRAGGTLVPVDAHEVAFLDDASALMLRSDEAGSTLFEVPVDAPDRPVWQRELRGVFWPRISVGPGSQWRLLGTDRNGRVVHIEGVPGKGVTAERSWSGPRDERTIEAVAVAGTKAIVVTTEYERDVLAGTRFWRWSQVVTPGVRTESRIEAWDASHQASLGSSRFDLSCQPMALDGERGVCAAFDGSRTRLVALNAGSDQLTALATLRGRFVHMGSSSPGWMQGWWDNTAVAIRPDTREVIRVEPRRGARATRLATANGTLGVLVFGRGTSAVELYDLR